MIAHLVVVAGVIPVRTTIGAAPTEMFVYSGRVASASRHRRTTWLSVLAKARCQLALMFCAATSVSIAAASGGPGGL